MLPTYVLVFSRTAIGLVFAASSLGKMRDLTTFERAIENFRALPASVANVVARLLLFAELAVVMSMVLGGWFLWIGFPLAALLLLIFSGALFSVLLRRMEVSCNCFGVTDKPVTGYDLLRNMGFITWAVVGWLELSLLSNEQIGLTGLETIFLALLAIVFVIVWSRVGEIAEMVRAL